MPPLPQGRELPGESDVLTPGHSGAKNGDVQGWEARRASIAGRLAPKCVYRQVLLQGRWDVSPAEDS